MKKLLYLLPFLILGNVWADTTTSGSVGFIKITTGSIDRQRHPGDKTNENWDIAAATFTNNINRLNALDTSTGLLANKTWPIVVSSNILDGQVTGNDIAPSITIGTIIGTGPITMASATFRGNVTSTQTISAFTFLGTTGSIGSVSLFQSTATGDTLKFRAMQYADGTLQTTQGISSAAAVVDDFFLKSTTVTAGQYTNASISVDADGRILQAANGAGAAASASGIGWGISFSTVGASTTTLSVRVSSMDINGTMVSIATDVSLTTLGPGGRFPTAGASAASVLTAFGCLSGSSYTVILASGNLYGLSSLPAGYSACTRIPYGVFRLDSGGAFAPFIQTDGAVAPYNSVVLLTGGSFTGQAYQFFRLDAIVPPTAYSIKIGHFGIPVSGASYRAETAHNRANRSADMSSSPGDGWRAAPSGVGVSSVEFGYQENVSVVDFRVKVRSRDDSNTAAVYATDYLVGR